MSGEGVIISLAFLIANLIVFGMNVKIYTEITKDKLQDKRSERAK